MTHNTEHLFSLELAERAPVTLAPQEHTAFAWLPWREAARKCFSWSNRDAILMIGAALLAAGCATGDGRLGARISTSGPAEVRECAQWYRALDAEIDAAGVRDAQYTRVPGFPHLRVDRLLASLRDRAAENEPALRAFGERLLELDLEARQHEIANLPALNDDARAPGAAPRAAIAAGCCATSISPARRRARRCSRAAQVPDDYSTAHRVLGLYALTQARVRRGRAALGEGHAGSVRARARPRRRTACAMRRRRRSRCRAAWSPGSSARATFDPLGIPGSRRASSTGCAAAYAPSFEIEIGGDYDRFGWLRWRRASGVPEVDAAEPSVYVHAAYTRYREPGAAAAGLHGLVSGTAAPRRGRSSCRAGWTAWSGA